MANRYSAPDLFMSCDQCGKLLVTTPSGYVACPAGHGKLRTAEPAQEAPDYFGLPFPEGDCRHCGRDIEPGRVDDGAIYCGHCVKVLEKHAGAAGVIG